MLTPRELEVMNLLIQGCTNPEISEKLTVTEHTTKAHLTSIYKKIGVKNRIQAILKYLKNNSE